MKENAIINYRIFIQAYHWKIVCNLPGIGQCSAVSDVQINAHRGHKK